MSTSQNKRDESPTPPATSTVVLLLGTIADTTWRMFAPTIIGLTVGFQLDSHWHSEPWVTLAGISVGILVTTVLIRQQLQNVEKTK